MTGVGDAYEASLKVLKHLKKWLNGFLNTTVQSTRQKITTEYVLIAC